MHQGDLALGRTAATLALIGWGLALVSVLPGPRERFHGGLVTMMAGSGIAVVLVEPARELFALTLPPPDVWMIVAALIATAYIGLGFVFSQDTRPPTC